MATVGCGDKNVSRLPSGLLRYSGSSRRPAPRGQAMVEFALVAPLFFALIFGLIEFSLIGLSISSYNLAADAGASIGSILGRTDPTVDQQIVAAVRSHTSGIAPAQPLMIEVFKADVTGAPVMSSGHIVENVYDIQGHPIGPQRWPVDSRIDDLLSADYLGVRITYQYNYLTGFIGGGNSTLQLTATSVQRIEPQDYQSRLAPSPTPVRLPFESYLADFLAAAMAAFAGRQTLGEGI